MLVLRAKDAFSPAQSTSDLGVRSIRGGAISIAGQGAQFAFQVGGTVVLARLLTPRDFGLVAMVAVIVAFGTILRDAGLSSATVQARTITHDQCAALFRVNVAVSIFLGVCVAAVGPAVARFYGHSELTWITVGLAVPLAIDGLCTQHSALLRRNMMFGAMAIREIGYQFSYFTAAVLTAFLGFGYWSLVIAHALGVVVVVTLTFAFCRWLPSRPAKGTDIRGLVRFGGHVLGSNVVNYFSANADNILVGKVLGADQLGLYSRAFNFFALPVNQIKEPIQRVGLPALRMLLDEPERYRRYYVRMTNIVATLSFPLGMMCIVEGGFFIKVLLGQQWLGATPVFRIFGAVMLIRPVMATVELVQLSIGVSRRYFLWSSVTAAVYVVSFAAGLPWGITGVAASFAIANYVLVLPTAAYCLARGPVKVRDFLGGLLVPLGMSGFAGGIALVVNIVVAHGLMGQGLGLVAFLVVYCGLSLARPSVRNLVPLLRGFPRVRA